MRKFLVLCCITLFAYGTHGQDAIATRVLKDSLFIPWEIIYGPDNHIWFTQKNGYVCRMDTAGNHTDTLLHEPTTITIKESGMLGMALHPDFVTQPYVYIAWEFMTLPDSNILERICRYTYSSTTNTLTSPYILIDSIKGFRFHNGCRVLIADDKLFMTIADAADSVTSQNPTSINGKILRINLDGTIPADNPIAGSPIWSLGHRNVQGIVYANDILYASEHGPNTDDEINIITKGSNYGWPYVRGFCDKTYETTFCENAHVVEPLYAWTPTIAPCGIDYYNHAMFPSMRHSLLMTTLKDSHLYRLQLNHDGSQITKAAIIQGINYGRLRDICISPDGKIFLSTSNSNSSGNAPFVDKIIEVYNPAYHESNTADCNIYPNPASDYIYVTLPPASTQLEYTIRNIEGKVVSTGTITPLQYSIPIWLLPAGIYNMALYKNGKQCYKGNFIHLN